MRWIPGARVSPSPDCLTPRFLKYRVFDKSSSPRRACFSRSCAAFLSSSFTNLSAMDPARDAAFCFYESVLFLLHFPMKRSANFEALRLFHFSLSVANSAAFLLSMSGTSPKSESGVGLAQFMSTCRITRCSSRWRMWPTQFHRLSLIHNHLVILFAEMHSFSGNTKFSKV